MAQYDLILQGGEVIDPASGRRGRSDVAFLRGSIAAIEPAIPAAEAARVESAAGKIVVPGLIDMHTHLFDGVGESVNADEGCLARGATTGADAGSAGALLIEAFRRLTAGNRTRVLAWLNLSTIGQVDTRVGELMALPWVDVDAAVAAAQAYPDLIVGLKARLSTYAAGGSCKPALRLLREAADATKLPVMVHVGDTGEPLSEIFAFLSPGDVVSHILTGRKNGILQSDGKIIPDAFAARKRGILFDAARGRNHVSFPVMQAAVEQDLVPDVLSTDITRFTAADPSYGVCTLATQLMSFGVPLERVVAAMTANPAAAMHRDDLGRLAVGGVGDATVLDVEEGEFTLRDVDGRSRPADRRLVPTAVVKAGVYMALEVPPAA